MKGDYLYKIVEMVGLAEFFLKKLYRSKRDNRMALDIINGKTFSKN